MQGNELTGIEAGCDESPAMNGLETTWGGQKRFAGRRAASGAERSDAGRGESRRGGALRCLR